MFILVSVLANLEGGVSVSDFPLRFEPTLPIW